MNYEEKKAKEYLINFINKTVESLKNSTKDMQFDMATLLSVPQDSYQVKHLAKEMHSIHKKEAYALIEIIKKVNVKNLKTYINEDEIKESDLYFVISQSLYALNDVYYLNKIEMGRKYNSIKKLFDRVVDKLQYNKLETTIRKPSNKTEISIRLIQNLQDTFKQDKDLENYVVALLGLSRLDAKDALNNRTSQTGAELEKRLKELPTIDLSEL